MENIYILILKKDDSIYKSQNVQTFYTSNNKKFEISFKINNKTANFRLFKLNVSDYNNIFFLKLLTSSEEESNEKIWTIENLTQLCTSLEKLDKLKNVVINIAIHWGGEKAEKGGWEEHTKQFIDDDNKIKGTNCFFTYYSEANDQVGINNIEELVKIIEARIKKKTIFIRELYALKEYILFQLYPLLWENNENELSKSIEQIKKKYDELTNLKGVAEIENVDLGFIDSLVSLLFENKDPLTTLEKIRNEFDVQILTFLQQYPEIKHIYG